MDCKYIMGFHASEYFAKQIQKEAVFKPLLLTILSYREKCILIKSILFNEQKGKMKGKSLFLPYYLLRTTPKSQSTSQVIKTFAYQHSVCINLSVEKD